MSVFLLTNWFVEKQWMFLYRRAPRASNFLIEVLYVTTVHQCRQNPLEEISGISLSHTHTMNVKGLTRVHGAGALRSCQSPWCSAVPAEHGSILARLSSQSSPSPDWLSPLEYSQSACPSVPSSALLFFLLMQQRLQWVSECVGERTCVCALCPSQSPPQQQQEQHTEPTGRGSCSLLQSEPENAARRTFASFSAVCGIDGVAEGMLTQHEFSPFPALHPTLLSLS